MFRFTVITLLVLLSIVEAKKRGLKGTKKEPKGYKASKKSKYPVSVGSRPYFILDSMEDSELKEELSECAEKKSIDEKSDWSIGHRGACMQVSRQ